MKMNSQNKLYRTILFFTLLFAASNLFTVSPVNAQSPANKEKQAEKKQIPQDNVELTLNKPIERELAGNEAHSYKIVLAAGQYLHVVVEQKGIDVIIALFAPDGEKAAEIDSPNGTLGEEPISFVAETAGNYRLEVRSLEKFVAAGHYEVKIEEMCPATTQDRLRVKARKLYLEAEKLRVQYFKQRDSFEIYEKALALYRLLGDSGGEALTLTDMGSVYRKLGENETAISYYNQAIPGWQAAGNLGGEAITLNYLGMIYKDLGNNKKAIEYYQKALRQFRTVNGRSGEAEVLFNIAVCEKESGNLISALSYSETSMNITESLRLSFGSDSLRETYFVPMPDFYEFYVDLLMQIHKQQPDQGFDAKALQASERARARTLLENLAAANADIRQDVDPKLLQRKGELQQLIAGKSERLTRISNDEKLKEQKAIAGKEVSDLLAQYQEVEAQIRLKSPRYAALTQPVPADLAEIQQLLDKDTVLLEYSLGEERSYLWLVTAQSLKSYELPKRARIEELADQFVAGVTGQNNAPKSDKVKYQKRQNFIEKAMANYPQVSAELGKILLGQIAPEIKDKRLLIVGDGVLQYVPFAALPKPVEAKSKTGGELLISSNEIVNLPSASTLAILRGEENERGGREYSKTVAVFADPVFDEDDKRVADKNEKTPDKTVATRGQTSDVENIVLRSANDVGLENRGGLRRLTESAREAEAIRETAASGQTTLALGFDASRERVLNGNFGDYRIVHFATHGFLNEEHPELSGVVLSLIDKEGMPQNGFLRLNDIYNLKLPVEMVVLSACQTGLGKNVRGEGLIGLTRGFMYAGAPRVVASLWSVDDFATKELMRIFYQKMLRENLSPAAALRAAQNELRGQKHWESPMFWAGFILQGEWRSITADKIKD